MSGMKKLLVYLKDYKKESVLAPLFKLLEAFFELLVPLVMAGIIDRGIAQNDMRYILKMGLYLVALAAIGLTVSVTAQFFAAKAAVGFSTKLRQALFSYLQDMNFTNIDQVGTATMITRMTSDINQVQNGVNMVLRLFLRSPVIVFGAMIMAFTIDVKSALIFVVTIPVLAVVVMGITLYTIPLYKKVQAGLDKVLSTTRENLTGVRVIRAFHREEQERAQFHAENTALLTMQEFVGRISACMNPATYIIINAATIVLIYTGAVQVNVGNLSCGEVVALLNYMSQILVELVKLANLVITITKALACADRVAQVFEIQPMTDHAEGDIERKRGDIESKGTDNERRGANAGRDIGEAAHNGEIMDIGKGTEDISQKAGDAGARSVGRGTGDVDAPYFIFDHVSLTYEGAGAETLKDIDFVVNKGETIGVIGGTGSGKTSLINLIPGFYRATEGAVRLKGRDLKDIPEKELRALVGMVPQKAVLFAGTIRSNLLWGNPDATDEDLWQAVELAQAKEVVDGKEGKLDAEIAQGGKNLSGGQRQRLTIARALVRKPEILILDDSASALDYATDAKLRIALQGLAGQMTTFIVSQRASSIRHADKIVVLDDGEMAGIGTHEELLQNCEVYQEIYYSQYPEERAGA